MNSINTVDSDTKLEKDSDNIKNLSKSVNSISAPSNVRRLARELNIDLSLIKKNAGVLDYGHLLALIILIISLQLKVALY